MREAIKEYFNRAKRKAQSFSLLAPYGDMFYLCLLQFPNIKLQMKKKHITESQRYEISAYLKTGKTKIEIATLIGVHRSSVTRELKRNRDKRSGSYNPDLAQRKLELRMKNRTHSIRFTDIQKELVDVLILDHDYSPDQICKRMRLKGLPIVSHETIYQYIWEDKKKGGKGLYTHLRRKGRKYHKRGLNKSSRGIIKDRVDISLRPSVVDEKKRFGDLEIDTVIGKNHKGALLTINDRKTGLVWIHKLKGKEAGPLTQEAIKTLSPFSNLIKTMTADNGKEFSFHRQIADKLKINVYFAKPYHSWERGANENTNGLIRQYFPKGMDFSQITDKMVADVQNKLNERPRKRLGYQTPLESFKLLTNLSFDNVALSS